MAAAVAVSAATAAAPVARLINVSLIEGIEANVVAHMAVRTIEIAAKGKASGSSEMDATPKPWDDEPIPNPRHTGSHTPIDVSKVFPYVAPKIPVMTTTLAAMEISPPII